MQANIHISMAVSPSALGEFELMLLKMLTRTRKRVIRSAILVKIKIFLFFTFNHIFLFLVDCSVSYLPGTMSGGIKKDIQETTTNNP